MPTRDLIQFLERKRAVRKLSMLKLLLLNFHGHFGTLHKTAASQSMLLMNSLKSDWLNWDPGRWIDWSGEQTKPPNKRVNWNRKHLSIPMTVSRRWQASAAQKIPADQLVATNRSHVFGRLNRLWFHTHIRLLFSAISINWNQIDSINGLHPVRCILQINCYSNPLLESVTRDLSRYSPVEADASI